MSLLVWLPLNGNLENQGLSNVTVTNNGATVNNNGKIGKCYSFSGGANCLIVNYGKNIPANNLSISCWAYIVANSNDKIIFGVANGSNQRLYVGIKSDYYQLAYGAQNWGSTPNTAKATIGEWHHIAVSISNNVCSMYYDGKFIHSISQVAFNLASDIMIGGRTDGYTGSVKINDFRIYNHALSAKEVKELAKGLVLHYRLAGPGQANLTKGNNTYERNSASTDGWFWFSGSNFNCKPSTTYTLSIDIDGTISDFHGGNASTDPAKRWASMWFYLCKTGTSTNAAGGGYDSPINLNSTNYNFRKIGPTRYAWTYTTPADARSLSIRGNTYSNGKDAIKVKFWNPKIEEGSIATPWCPRADESIYTTLGYNNNIEYDCSGYGNNGIKVGNIAWSGDSARYSGSYDFNGTGHIKTGFSATMNELSCSFWVKPNSQNGGYAIIASNYNNPPGGFWIAVNCEFSGLWFYSGATYVKGNSLLSNDIWHHGVFTYNRGICKWYVNGKLVTTADISSRGTYLSISNLSIGNSYTGTSWNTKFYGNISDFRLYSKCLSADDVKSLYNVSASIDNTGVLSAYEFVEEG